MERFPFQLAWLIYAITTIFRKTKSGAEFIYLSGMGIPTAVFVLHLVHSVCGFFWVFIYCWHHLIPALLFLLVTPVVLIAALVIALRRFRNTEYQHNLKEYWLQTVVFHNGLAVYACWMFLAAIIHLGIVLIHGGADVSRQGSATAMLVLLVILTIGFCTLELTYLDAWLRFVVAHYVALITVLAGSVSANWDGGYHNSIFTLVILIIVIVFLVLKIILMIYRTYRYSKSGAKSDTNELHSHSEA